MTRYAFAISGVVLALLETSHAGYKSYGDIVSSLNTMAAQSQGSAVAFDAGETVNGTKIRGIVISRDAQASNTPKPDIVIVATIHARE